MENKKKFVIILIVLFIFLGLTIFTFANPGDDELKGNGGNTNNSNVTDKDKNDDQNSSSDLDNDAETTDDNRVQNPVNGAANAEAPVDDTYAKALQAVIEAEQKIESNSYGSAQSLVDDLKNESQKTELQERLDEVQEGIDVKGLVESLRQQTKAATNKAELDQARDFRTSKDIVSKVADLTIENLKDELNKTLDELAKTLDDVQAPTITGVENNSINNKKVALTVDDQNAKATVNGKEVSLNELTFEEDGTYTVTVTDEAFNETTVEFTIDMAMPIGTVTYSETEWTNNDVTVTMTTSEAIETPAGWTKVDDKTFTKVYTENTTETVEITDKAGNKGSVDVAISNIDKEEPTVAIGGTTGSKYWKQPYEFTVTITEDNLESVYYAWNGSNNENSMKSALNSASAIKVAEEDITDNGDGTYTVKIKADVEGRHMFNIKVVDKAGNETMERKGWYQIDATAPSILVGETVYGPEHTETIYITGERFTGKGIDELSGIATSKVNGADRMTFNQSWAGPYTVVLTDKAGNTSTFKVVLDKDIPVIKGAEDGGYYNTPVTLTVEEKNIDNVVLTKDGNVVEGYTLGTEISEEGEYTLTVTDKVNNTVSITFTIDKTKPEVKLYVVKGNKEVEPGYYTDDMYAIITDAHEYTALLNGAEYISGTKISRGNYTLVVTDVAGNSVTVEFGVDKNPPAFKLNGQKIEKKHEEVMYYDEDVTVTYSELNEVSFTFEKDGEALEFTNGMTLTKNGRYYVKATDKAGNVTEFTFVIDKEEPTVAIGGTTGSKYWKQPYEFTVTITEDNLESVYYAWNGSNNENSMKSALNSASAIKVAEEDITDNGDGTYTVKIKADVEGRHMFNIKVVDKAGNETMERKGWYQIDATAPSILVGETVYGPEHTETIYITGERFTGKGIDELSGIATSKVNGADRMTFNQSWAGPYTVVLTDKAGNTSTFKVVLSRKGPEAQKVNVNISNGTYPNVKAGDTVHIEAEYYASNKPKTVEIAMNGVKVENIKIAGVAYPGNSEMRYGYSTDLVIPDTVKPGDVVTITITAIGEDDGVSVITKELTVIGELNSDLANMTANVTADGIVMDEFPYLAMAYSKTQTGNTLKESTITVTSANDEEYNEFIAKGYRPESVIWWAQFSCDSTRCEGFNERGTNNKNATIVEGRRGDVSIVMEAPAAKEGYEFVGWEVSTIDYSGIKIQGFEAKYEPVVSNEANIDLEQDSIILATFLDDAIMEAPQTEVEAFEEYNGFNFIGSLSYELNYIKSINI